MEVSTGAQHHWVIRSRGGISGLSEHLDLQFSTYLGGSSFDTINGITTDSQGDIYIVGQTESEDFPTTEDVYNTSCNGGGDCFVTKLSPDGSEALFSTFVGGSGGDRPVSLALDDDDNCIVVGWTSSTNFPVNTTNDQPTCHSLGGNQDGFVFKLSGNGSTLGYSMYLGSGTNDEARDVAVDAQGNAVIVGSTGSADFPMVNAYDDTLDGIWDCVIVKLNATGHIIFSTYYGGSGIEYTSAVALDDLGTIYVAGMMKGGTFPMIGVYNQIFNGTWGIFLLVMNSLGTEIIFSGVLRDSATEDDRSWASNIMVVPENEVWLGGYTEYSSFPITEDALDREFERDEGFIMMVDPVHSSLNYSSFFGGSRWDEIVGIAVTNQGNIIGAGCTDSTDIPILNALEPDMIGPINDEDLFVFKLERNETTTTSATTTPTGVPELLFIAVAGSGIALVLIVGIIIKTRKY